MVETHGDPSHPTDLEKGYIGEGDIGCRDVLPDRRDRFYRDMERDIVIGSCARAGKLIGKNVLLKRGKTEEGRYTMAVTIMAMKGVTMEEAAYVAGDVCCLGTVKIGRASVVGGNVIGGRAEIHRQTVISGNLISTEDIYIGSDCEIDGLVVSLEGEITVGERCSIGALSAYGSIRIGQDLTIHNDVVHSVRGRISILSNDADPTITTAHTLALINEEGLAWDEIAPYCYQQGEGSSFNANRIIFTKRADLTEAWLKSLAAKWRDISIALDEPAGHDVFGRLGFPIPESDAEKGGTNIYGDVVMGNKTEVRDSVVSRSNIG